MDLITCINLCMFNHPGISVMKHTWYWWMISLLCSWILFASTLLMLRINNEHCSWVPVILLFCFTPTPILDLLVWDYFVLLLSLVWLPSPCWSFLSSAFCDGGFVDKYCLKLVLSWSVLFFFSAFKFCWLCDFMMESLAS